MTIFAACATDELPIAGEDPSTLGDEIDEDTKADGAAAPGGLYLVDFDSAIEDAPLIEILDLRANKTFFRSDSALSADDDYNYSTGWSSDRGTFKFSRTRSTGKTYIRFYEENGDLLDVWRYTLEGSTLHFYYRNGEGFDTLPQAKPTTAWTRAVVDRVRPLAEAETIDALPDVSPYAAGIPTAAYDAALALGEPSPGGGIDLAPMYRFAVSGKTAYVVATDARLEIYDRLSRLVAGADMDGGTLTWDAL